MFCRKRRKEKQFGVVHVGVREITKVREQFVQQERYYGG